MQLPIWKKEKEPLAYRRCLSALGAVERCRLQLIKLFVLIPPRSHDERSFASANRLSGFLPSYVVCGIYAGSADEEPSQGAGDTIHVLASERCLLRQFHSLDNV